MGTETKDHKFNIIGKRAVISLEIVKEQMKKGSFCELDDWSKK
jgi:hypothetical protein